MTTAKTSTEKTSTAQPPAVLTGEPLNWKKMAGILPCVVQDATTAQVLMVGYMNEAALAHTLETQQVTFWSRSKERLWTKGETSGNTLTLVRLSTDCDGDALLALVQPAGPTCHRNRTSCFTVAPPDVAALGTLQRTIGQRAQALKTPPPPDAHKKKDKKKKKSAQPEQQPDNQFSGSSYTQKLLQKGIRHCAQKVGEEGVEVALASVAQDDHAVCEEAADLLYHLLVLLQARNLTMGNVLQVLQARATQNTSTSIHKKERQP